MNATIGKQSVREPEGDSDARQATKEQSRCVSVETTDLAGRPVVLAYTERQDFGAPHTPDTPAPVVGFVTLRASGSSTEVRVSDFAPLAKALLGLIQA